MRNSGIIQRLRAVLLRAPELWLALLCLLVLGRGLAGDFVMDDGPVIQNNSKITELKFIPDYFTHGVWRNTDLADQANLSGNSLYRPLFLLTLNVAHHLWGASPFGFHALNLLLHGVNTVLIFYLLVGLIPADNRVAALVGAALFAVHPVHVESIAWAAGLTDPLVTLFLLSALLYYRRYIRTGRLLFAGLALTSYAAGLLCKEVAIFYPLLLVLHDAVQRQLRPWRYLPYVGLLVCYLLVRSAALGIALDWAQFDVTHWPLLLEFISRYIQLLIFPWPLDYYYVKPVTNLPAIVLGTVTCIAAAVYAVRALRRHELPPLLGFAWIVITLLPALPLALLDEPVFATRVLYLPSVGFAMLIAWGYSKARLRAASGYASAGLIVVFSVVSVLEIADWRDNATFYTRAAQTSPQAAQPYAGLAESYEHSGNINQAMELNLKAAALASSQYERMNFLEKSAELTGQQGDIATSERYYHEILRALPQRSSAWVGLGNNALARGDTALALTFYTNAFEADANNFAASYNLALTYRNLGDTERARYFENISRRLQTTP